MVEAPKPTEAKLKKAAAKPVRKKRARVARPALSQNGFGKPGGNSFANPGGNSFGNLGGNPFGNPAVRAR